MREDEIKQLMTEWGIRPIPGEASEHNVLGFARAVEAKEREACAQSCEALTESCTISEGGHQIARLCAFEIRIRSNG